MEKLLTTIDNPWSPFTHWDEWYEYDESSGYHTCGLLARFAIVSDDLSDYDYEKAVEQAMNEIVKLNPLGIHRIINEKEKIDPIEVEKVQKKLEKFIEKKI